MFLLSKAKKEEIKEEESGEGWTTTDLILSLKRKVRRQFRTHRSEFSHTITETNTRPNTKLKHWITNGRIRLEKLVGWKIGKTRTFNIRSKQKSYCRHLVLLSDLLYWFMKCKVLLWVVCFVCSLNCQLKAVWIK